MNFELFKAIKEAGLTQTDFARLAGEHKSVVSRVVNGIWNPGEARKLKYAKILKKRLEDIFCA